MLFHTGRFIHKQTAFIPVKQIHKGNRLRIKIADIAFQVRPCFKFQQFLLQFLHLGCQAIGLFGLKLLTEFLAAAFRLSFNLFYPSLQFFLRKNHLRGGINFN